MPKLLLPLSLFLVLLTLAGPAAADTDVVIHELFYLGNASEDWVEIRNTGSEPVDITSWWICARFLYRNIGALPLLDGDDLLLQPGEIVTVGTDIDLNGSSSDFALFIVDDFDDPNDMADYLQYGTSMPVGRSNEALNAGLWSETSKGVLDFIPLAPAGQSTSFCGDSVVDILSMSLDFVNGATSRGAENEICNEVFSDGFESGDAAEWSNIVPIEGPRDAVN